MSILLVSRFILTTLYLTTKGFYAAGVSLDVASWVSAGEVSFG